MCESVHLHRSLIEAYCMLNFDAKCTLTLKAYFFASMPVGGVQSVFFLPISFQFVDNTVPLDSCRTAQTTKAALACTGFMNTDDRQEDHAFLMTAKVDVCNAALQFYLWPEQPAPTEVELITRTAGTNPKPTEVEPITRTAGTNPKPTEIEPTTRTAGTNLEGFVHSTPCVFVCATVDVFEKLLQSSVAL